MKVSGSYESVVRGVSQQVPMDRRSGQHTAQVNMISDPVRGLTRRQGSRLLAETAVVGAGTHASLVADTAYHKSNTFYIDGVDYDLIYRTAATLSGASAFAFAYNRATNQFLPVVRAVTDPLLDQLISGGVSAIMGIGRYVYMAGNSITPTYTATDNHGPVANSRKVVGWVRGGAFSRTFKIKITKIGGVKVEGIYKTVSASYPTLLDTSDLLTSDPDYQKKVNDRVYAYNSEATKWIGTAAADITPENIATQLAADLTAKGITGCVVIGGTVTIDNTTIAEATGEDGGDGSLLRVVGQEVTAPELVSTIHYAGKYVKVKPQRSRGDDALYLVAVPKVAGATGFVEVSWKEAAGYSMQPNDVFCMGTVVAGTMYIAGSAAILAALTSTVVPGFQANAVGDALTSPLPSFFGAKITYLGMFQDRLVIGSGGTLILSRPGDYLNFFRQSVLTVLDSDPWEGYALGSENDTIHYSTTYDRDIVFYGERFQYSISGRIPLTPKTASIIASSAYKDATDAAPRANGNYVFYAKSNQVAGGYNTAVHQVGNGPIAESPESYAASAALTDLMVGKPVELLAMASPNFIMVRTDSARNSLFTYTYLDNSNGSERLFDSWSPWTWDAQLGVIAGITARKGKVNIYMIRQRGEASYIACEQFTVDTSLSILPYADSLQTRAAAIASASMVGTTGAIIALARDGGVKPFMGTDYSNIATFNSDYPTELTRAWVGFPFAAYVTPTNPFMRDQKDKAILTGSRTLMQVKVAVAQTGGITGDVTSSSGVARTLDFNGAVLGQPILIGEQPIGTTSLSLFVGHEVRACSYTLTSKLWLPMTITNLAYTAQDFNNVRQA